MPIATAVELWGPSAWKFLHAISFAYPAAPDTDQPEPEMAQEKELREQLRLRHLVERRDRRAGDVRAHEAERAAWARAVVDERAVRDALVMVPGN